MRIKVNLRCKARVFEDILSASVSPSGALVLQKSAPANTSYDSVVVAGYAAGEWKSFREFNNDMPQSEEGDNE